MRRGTGIGAALCAALLLAPTARAANKEAIQKAVDKGAAYLKSIQGADGTWRYSEIGATALCGLALVESGVPANDPAVQKAAAAVRDQSIALDRTYSLSLAIMFLDRLGEPADALLIESMAIRLLAGQDPESGGWGYTCPSLSPTDAQRLRTALQQHNELVAKQPPAGGGRPTVKDLPQEIQQQLRLINQQAAGGNFLAGSGDNSNTQFAVLALWIARRKGIPVETALHRIDLRFKTTQQADGGWGYIPPPASGLPQIMPGASGSTPAMTCAGLLGLALSHGSAMETTLRAGPTGGAAAPARGGPAHDISRDPIVRKGLLHLGTFMGKPLAQIGGPANMGPAPGGLPGFGLPPGARGAPPGPPANQYVMDKAYYFLFSLERVAVAYGLDTIGDKNWYDWGSDALLQNQNQDGSWTGDFGAPGAGTSFALLFLQRANLAKDLSATLKGRVADPGKHELRSIDVENPEKGGSTKPQPAGNETPAPAPPKEVRPAVPAVDPEVARLSDELVQADTGRQGQVLEKLRKSKGAVYTDALAHAIPRLNGPAKADAREALADRLTRMKKETLGDKLRDDDAEVRRAAALACAMKDEKSLVPRLIELFQDPDVEVARAAYAALKNLTGKDFGPGKGADKIDFARSADAWKEWWSKNGDK